MDDGCSWWTTPGAGHRDVGQPTYCCEENRKPVGVGGRTIGTVVIVNVTGTMTLEAPVAVTVIAPL